MNINSSNTQSINQIQNLQTIDLGRSTNKSGTMAQEVNKAEHQVSISKVGQVGSYIANLPEEQQVEIKDYLQSIRTAKENGSFDIQASINSAPEAFNILATELNISSEEALTVMSEKPPKHFPKSTAETEKSTGISAYADVAAQSKTNNEKGSIFEMFTSLFSNDDENELS